MADDIRSLIREVLAEELKKFRSAAGAAAVHENRVETVSISSDADLNDFAKRVFELAGNEKTRSDIKSGKLSFRLAGSSPTAIRSGSATAEPIMFEKGLISEKKITDLPDGATVRAAKAVCFTPLALDEIRRKRISVERMKK